jgi:hypothetical protein
VVVLDTPDGAALSRDAVVLGPRSSATVNVSITAPTTPGRYEQRVVHHRYLGVLPTGVFRALDGVGHWLGVVAADAVVVTVLGVVGRFLFGTGRIRFRDGRSVPLSVSIRRSFRRLYR